MYAIHLEKALLCDQYTRPLYAGIYAADTLPRTVTRPSLLIANTDPKRKPGAHWVAFYIDTNGYGEYFDSYGLPPIVETHRQFLDRQCTTWTWNSVELQSYTSRVCGEYCVLYLAHKARGLSLNDFMCIYERRASNNKNDIITKKIFKQNFSKCLNKMHDISNNQCCCKRKK